MRRTRLNVTLVTCMSCTNMRVLQPGKAFVMVPRRQSQCGYIRLADHDRIGLD